MVMQLFDILADMQELGAFGEPLISLRPLHDAHAGVRHRSRPVGVST